MNRHQIKDLAARRTRQSIFSESSTPVFRNKIAKYYELRIQPRVRSRTPRVSKARTCQRLTGRRTASAKLVLVDNWLTERGVEHDQWKPDSHGRRWRHRPASGIRNVSAIHDREPVVGGRSSSIPGIYRWTVSAGCRTSKPVCANRRRKAVGARRPGPGPFDREGAR